MSLSRSQKMSYYNLIISKESAWEILNRLGELELLHIEDKEPNIALYNKPYANYVKRCEEVLLKLNFIESQMIIFKKAVKVCKNHKEFMRNLFQRVEKRNKAKHTYLDEVEEEIEERIVRLQEQLKNFEKITKDKNTQIEKKAVLEKTQSMLGSKAQAYTLGSQNWLESDLNEMEVQIKSELLYQKMGDSADDIRINYIAGVINKEDSLRFKRMVFRIGKGNVWTIFEKIEEDFYQKEEYIIGSENPSDKLVFLMIFSGGSFNVLKQKLYKICDSFGATTYDIPESNQKNLHEKAEAEKKLLELRSISKLTQNSIEEILDQFSEPKNEEVNYSLIQDYKLFVLKEKELYHTMNKFKLENSIFIGFAWIPKEKEELVIEELHNFANKSKFEGAQIFEIRNCDQEPPTHFETNEFTWAFQEVVNTYGIPRY